jgi:transposase
MAKSLSVDLRSRVVTAVDAGASCRSATARFGVSVSSAVRWVARDRERGDLEPDIRGAIDTLTPSDCRSYFTAAGYEPE